jgi:hypothetical protein
MAVRLGYFVCTVDTACTANTPVQHKYCPRVSSGFRPIKHSYPPTQTQRTLYKYKGAPRSATPSCQAPLSRDAKLLARSLWLVFWRCCPLMSGLTAFVCMLRAQTFPSFASSRTVVGRNRWVLVMSFLVYWLGHEAGKPDLAFSKLTGTCEDWG